MKKSGKKDYRKLCDKLIRLLFACKHDSRSGYVDMVWKSQHAAKLDRLLKQEHRCEWRKIGVTLHLIDLGLEPPTSVAYILPLSSRRVEWHILGRRPFNGMGRSIADAKRKVEFHFEVIQEEE